MIEHAFCIPFRDRGIDPLRKANLERVIDHLENFDLGPIHVVSDNRSGTEQFNRHAAYNSLDTEASVVTYYESDMLVPRLQLMEAIKMAAEKSGLVVPFTTYNALSEEDSAKIRAGEIHYRRCTPESTRTEGKNVGAVNTLSRLSLTLVGRWDEAFEGSWYDDRSMCRAFEICCGPTRYIKGSAWHLYHLPGWKGKHLTTNDKMASFRNEARFHLYKRAKTAGQIRKLTMGMRDPAKGT